MPQYQNNRSGSSQSYQGLKDAYSSIDFGSMPKSLEKHIRGQLQTKMTNHRDNYRLGATGTANTHLQKLMSGNFGVKSFQQMAASSTPGVDTFAGIAGIRGAQGNHANILGQQQFNEASQQNSAGALQQYSQYQLGLQTQAVPGLLGLLGDFQKFPIEAEMFMTTEHNRNKAAVEASRNQMWADIFGTGSGIVTSSLL